MKKCFFSLIVCLSFCAVGVLNPLRTHALTATPRIYFYEAGTDFPVNDVWVVVVESKQKLKLNCGDPLPLPEANAVTLLFFKAGYADTAVFGFCAKNKPYAKYALYQSSEYLPYVAYAETPCEKDILALFTAYKELIGKG